MSGRMSRVKGSNAEREVVNKFRERGFNLQRTPLSGGMKWKGDVLGLDGFHIEIKRQETLSLPKWLDQAESEAPKGEVPLVIFRKSRDPWRVVIQLDNFIELLEAKEQWENHLLTTNKSPDCHSDRFRRG